MDIRALFIGGPKDGETSPAPDMPICIVMANYKRREYERRRVVVNGEVVQTFVLKGMDDDEALARVREIMTS